VYLKKKQHEAITIFTGRSFSALYKTPNFSSPIIAINSNIYTHQPCGLLSTNMPAAKSGTAKLSMILPDLPSPPVPYIPPTLLQLPDISRFPENWQSCFRQSATARSCQRYWLMY